MGKLYKNFVFDIIAATLCLALGIVMLPPIGIGERIVRILFALTLLAYLIFYLFDKVRTSRGTVFILGIVEFIIVSLIVVDLILEQFNVFSISGVCHTVGVVLTLRGVISALTLYVSAYFAKRRPKNLLLFIFSLILIMGGVFLFAKPILSDYVINWALCGLCFLCFLIFCALALLFSPDRKAKKQS